MSAGVYVLGILLEDVSRQDALKHALRVSVTVALCVAWKSLW